MDGVVGLVEQGLAQLRNVEMQVRLDYIYFCNDWRKQPDIYILVRYVSWYSVEWVENYFFFVAHDNIPTACLYIFANIV